MSANRFGQILQMQSFGESHGAALGVIVEGCPAGLAFDFDYLRICLERRRPGGALQSARAEPDEAEVLSGVFEGKTLGTPIAIIVRNRDQRSQDYEKLRTNYRNGHADDLWQNKFGHRDHRGGGRASGRETVSRVMAGAISDQLLKHLVPACEVVSWVSQIGNFSFNEENISVEKLTRDQVDSFALRFPSADDVVGFIEELKKKGESVGGRVTTLIKNPPAGLGQPVYHKLKADLAHALTSIGATTGVQWGRGFDSANARGQEFHRDARGAQYGGIRGGLSTGEPILIETAFKPTSSVGQVALSGRHDPLIMPRAVPVIDAMVSFVLADHLLWQRLDRI